MVSKDEFDQSAQAWLALMETDEREVSSTALVQSSGGSGVIVPPERGLVTTSEAFALSRREAYGGVVRHSRVPSLNDLYKQVTADPRERTKRRREELIRLARETYELQKVDVGIVRGEFEQFEGIIERLAKEKFGWHRIGYRITKEIPRSYGANPWCFCCEIGFNNSHISSGRGHSSGGGPHITHRFSISLGGEYKVDSEEGGDPEMKGQVFYDSLLEEPKTEEYKGERLGISELEKELKKQKRRRGYLLKAPLIFRMESPKYRDGDGNLRDANWESVEEDGFVYIMNLREHGASVAHCALALFHYLDGVIAEQESPKTEELARMLPQYERRVITARSTGLIRR